MDSSLCYAAFRMTVGSEVIAGVPAGNLGYTPLVKVFVKLGSPGAADNLPRLARLAGIYNAFVFQLFHEPSRSAVAVWRHYQRARGTVVVGCNRCP